MALDQILMTQKTIRKYSAEKEEVSRS